jgi:DNA-nicking Smr family endonuclease
LTNQKSKDPKKPQRTFGDYVGRVRPLAAHAGRVPPASPPKAPGASQPLPPAESAAEPVFDVKDDGFVIEGARVGLGRTVRELKQGRFPIVETLDLHGFTIEEASRELRRFCDETRGSQRRAVLIVHGKGTHSPGGRGALRGEMAAWLSSAPLGHHVLCFTTARAKDGGQGALYVLLAARHATR